MDDASVTITRNMEQPSFEKLGVFYLGKAYDLAAKKRTDELILYDSKDLVTHAVCVGMTGSGKTGLCLAILEEAAIDGIPAIIIDPKGDLANLLLTFPNLAPADFRPWVNEDDARKTGQNVDQYAAGQADLWKNGLAKWGEDGARIQRLRDAADFAIYTPGSNAGLGVSILRSFAAPEQAVRDDGELLRERIATTATSLLGLLGVDADPIQSREHILLSTIIGSAWQNGRDLDLAALIGQIQNPPVQRVGVMDVESFFPSKDRFALAMRLNNLLAAPGFGAWLEGEPLDIQAMLHGPSGKPRHAIFSIAHLGDAERMFFVSLLLNQVLGWMRQQPGTTSLRAIVYMDEIFGYFPPHREPAEQGAAADADETGPRVRRRDDAGDAEPGGPGLQGLEQRRHVAHRPTADGARQEPAPRWPGRRGGGRRREVRPRSDGTDARRAGQPRVPDEQRARGCAGGVREPLGPVVPARAAHAAADQDADGSAQGPGVTCGSGDFGGVDRAVRRRAGDRGTASRICGASGSAAGAAAGDRPAVRTASVERTAGREAGLPTRPAGLREGLLRRLEIRREPGTGDLPARGADRSARRRRLDDG
jgi:hypothetical protein